MRQQASTSSIKRVSGPVSAHVFDLEREGKGCGRVRVYVFGDQHHRWDNLCPQPCSSSTPGDACVDIIRFVRAAVREAEREDGVDRHLDVFLEMPYVSRAGPLRDRWLKAIDVFFSSKKDPPKAEVFGRSSSASSAKTSSRSAASGALKKKWGMFGGAGDDRSVWRREAVAQAIGDAPEYVGVFAHLYREFRGRLYEEGRADTHSRFHYCDARQEPHVSRLFPVLDPVKFHKHFQTSEQLKEVLVAFLFSRDFPADVRRLCGSEVAGRLLLTEALSDGMHKVAKQFHALQPGKLKDAVKLYLNDRVEDAMRVVRDDLGFDRGAAALAAADEAKLSVHFQWLKEMREAKGQLYLALFPLAMTFAVHLVIMDAYLICRLARFCLQETAARKSGESVGIVYVGDTHAEYYAAFFKDYLGVQPSVCSKLHSSGDQPSRCTSLIEAPSSSCPTFGQAPMRL